jgi:hypothetical protein
MRKINEVGGGQWNPIDQSRLASPGGFEMDLWPCYLFCFREVPCGGPGESRISLDSSCSVAALRLFINTYCTRSANKDNI